MRSARVDGQADLVSSRELAGRDTGDELFVRGGGDDDVDLTAEGLDEVYGAADRVGMIMGVVNLERLWANT